MWSSFGKQLDLSGKNFCNQNLSGMNLSGNRVELWKTNFSGATLTDTKLINSNLRESKLNRARMLGAYLQKSRLIDTEMTGIYLSEADLSEVVLIRVNKTENADFKGADFTGAIIINSDLSKVKGLELSQISKAKICDSIFPSELKIDLKRDCTDQNVKSWRLE
jgi:uncharacterized protein YjbI with pentapeptide repeats